jgi:hypothetical protein
MKKAMLSSSQIWVNCAVKIATVSSVQSLLFIVMYFRYIDQEALTTTTRCSSFQLIETKFVLKELSRQTSGPSVSIFALPEPVNFSMSNLIHIITYTVS